MNLILRTMELFVAFFIIITGITLMPQVFEMGSKLESFIYGLSIVFSSAYFVYLGMSNKKNSNLIIYPKLCRY